MKLVPFNKAYRALCCLKPAYYSSPPFSQLIALHLTFSVYDLPVSLHVTLVLAYIPLPMQSLLLHPPSPNSDSSKAQFGLYLLQEFVSDLIYFVFQ